jgi:NTE family protein
MPQDYLRPKTAFVLAGGGSFGAIQVGMLRALAAHGVTADFVVGASVGAVNGAYYAGNPTSEGVAELERLWRGLNRRDIFPITWRSILAALRGGNFVVSSDGLRRLVEMRLPYRNLEQAAIPMYVIATDMLSGEMVVFSEGPAATAIIASAAIPAAFAPVEHNSLFLVDGALTSNTPIRVAVERGATRLIVLPTGFACALTRPPSGAVASALHAVTLLIARQLAHEIEAVEKIVDVRIAPPLCPLNGSAYDFSQTADLIERAAKTTEQWISEGGLDIYHLPCGLHAHSHRGEHDPRDHGLPRPHEHGHRQPHTHAH